MKIFSLLQTKYHLIEQAVKTYLSKQLTDMNTSYGNNTVFGQLINVLNNTVQNMMLYIEDSLVEQNKYTAQRKKSIYGLAAISGYNPCLGKAAGVQLTLSYIPTNESDLNIIINNHEQVTCTQNGLIYNLILPQEAIILSVDKDNSSKYIYAVQGRFETQSFVSTGGKYYTQNVNFVGNLDTDYMTVKVNNEKWDYCVSVYDMDADGKQWTYKISPVGGIDIVFGNDCYGRALKPDDFIEIKYLLHDGDSGNMDINNESYFVFNNNLKDISGKEIDGNNVFNIVCTTIDDVTSGTNSESIEQVRQMIGFNSRALVLASPENYKVFLNKFSFCGYNRTWTERGSMVVNSLIMKNYKLLLNESKTYFDLKEEDFKLSKTQKQSILNCINNSGQQLAGTTYNIFDPELCKYALYIYVKLKSISYDKISIESQIRKHIAEFFSNINSDIFVPKSDITHLLKNNIPEIDGVTLYFLSEKNETALQTKTYDKVIYKYDPITGSYKKEIQKVYLYDGENPNLGLDAHGNIYLESDEQFPVLMGGWDYLNGTEEITITDPLIIVFE